MSRTCGIYKLTSPSGKIYIGQSINIERRLVEYRYIRNRDQTKLYRSFKKYGLSEHNIEIIVVCEAHELDYWERFYIDVYNTFNTDHGMNLTQGGKSYKGIMADETKIKHRRPHSPETRAKIGKAHVGMKRSEQAKANMRKPHKRGYKLKTKRECLSLPVYCKDTDGVVLKFTSVKDCSIVTGISVSAIRRNMKINRLTKGFLFSPNNIES